MHTVFTGIRNAVLAVFWVAMALGIGAGFATIMRIGGI